MNKKIIYHDKFRITHIVKKNLKNSYIQIEKSGEIVLKTPQVSSLYIEELIRKKSSWIENSLLKLKPQLQYSLKEEILFLGKLQIFSQCESFEQLSIMINKKIDDNRYLQKCHDQFYRVTAQEYLYKELTEYADRMNLYFTQMKLRKMKRRWGSCNSNGVITLNTYLMKLEPIMIKYVVIHELVHLKHMNHSKDFYKEVEKWMPEYKDIQNKIKSFPI